MKKERKKGKKERKRERKKERKKERERERESSWRGKVLRDASFGLFLTDKF